MPPATKSKAKDRKSGKESQKVSIKSSGHVNTGGGNLTNGYNPLSGTFHAIETTQLSSSPTIHANGRFQNIEETDDHSSYSYGNGVDYDSFSNNGSWSGESEDHKEKVSLPAPREEVIPGVDNDKREKIRQKNEKKHQRQRERRAQELHDKCNGYLMSRKLEALAQQLVAMGFSFERATMALILNEGKVEKSVAWLFEEGEDAGKHREHKLDYGGNLKMDISEELAKIADMEIRYKCSKQEVQRAVVASEGDLEKAEEKLRVQKQEPPTALPKPEETGDHPTVSNGKVPVTAGQNLIKELARPSTSSILQQKREEQDLDYSKVAVTVGAIVDPGSKNIKSLKRIQPKLEWAKSQQTAIPIENRWPNSGSNPPVSYSLVSPPQAKSETQYMSIENELKNLQLGSVREPVMVLQRAQSTIGKQPTSAINSSPPGTAAGWYPSNIETINSKGVVPNLSSTRNLNPYDATLSQLYNQHHYQQQQQLLSISGSVDPQAASRINGLWSRKAIYPTVAAASSLGLFSGLGLNGSSGSPLHVDWNTGCSVQQLDYANIDWSLDGGSSTSNGMWHDMNSFVQNNPRVYDSYDSGRNIKVTARSLSSNGNGVSMGLQDRLASVDVSAVDSRERASPFEEKDISSLPRQFVYSPSL